MGDDSLVKLKGDNNRWAVSEKCESEIKKNLIQNFPFGVVWDVVKEVKEKLLKNLITTNNKFYSRIFIYLIISYYVYSNLRKVNFLIYLLISFV